MSQKLDKNDKHRFVCLGKKDEYYFEKIRIFQVLRFLFLYNKIFGQRFRVDYPRQSYKWFYNLILFKYRILKKNCIQLIRICKFKLGLRKHEDLLSLKHFGEFCVIVNKGYKIFNFKKKTVKKIFRNEISERIVLNELELLKESQNTQYAPVLLRWNIEEKWYEEQLIKGKRDFSHYPRKTKNLIKNFKTTIEPAIQEIIFSIPIDSYYLTHIHRVYSEKIADVLNATPNLKAELREKIEIFAESQLKILGQEIDSSIFCGFTHGDFCPANILNTSKGISLIDWEGAAFRSILFDFYSYFFYRPTHQIFDDFYGLINEINQALGILIGNMDPRFKELKENITVKKNIYRVVYYIERTIMLTERLRQDEKLNIEKIIFDFINAFEKYEAEFKAHNSVEVSNIAT